MRAVLAGFLALVAAACGSSSPSAPSLVLTGPDFGGTWTGTSTASSFTGGDCLAPLLAPTVGSTSNITLTITESGANVTLTTAGANGSTCTYTGSSNGSSIALNWTRCEPPLTLGTAQCPSGESRDVRLVSSAISAALTNNQLTGTETESYDVLVSGTSTSVGPLVLNSTFTATRQ